LSKVVLSKHCGTLLPNFNYQITVVGFLYFLHFLKFWYTFSDFGTLSELLAHFLGGMLLSWNRSKAVLVKVVHCGTLLTNFNLQITVVGFLYFLDPYLNKRPLSRAVVSARNLDFISDCFKIGSAYFGITQTSQGPIFTKIFPKKIEPLIPNHLSSPESGSTRSSTPFDVITMEELENSLFEKASEKGEPKSEKDEEQLSFEELREKFGTELSCDEALQISQLVPKEKILFEFSQRNLTGGKVIYK